MSATPIYAGLLALLVILLSVRVIGLRRGQHLLLAQLWFPRQLQATREDSTRSPARYVAWWV
jgi:hypothetical protein